MEKYHSVTSIPFSSEKPPVTLTAFMKEVHWETEEGFPTVCATSPKYDGYAGDEEAITLFPYGCAKLRVTEFPYVKKGEKHLGTV